MKTKKVRKFLSVILLVIILSFNSFCFAYEEDPDAWDYVWLNEAIDEANKSKEPQILSRYAVVYDRNSGTILWGKEENTKVPMASTTKIMTAIILMENIGDDRLAEEIVVSKEAANTIGSRLDIHTGNIVTYNDLLYGLMLCSGNDAAVQIAISVAGSVENFANLMNQKAEDLGLENTHFITPHGLDRDMHYTTALELAKITDYALKIPKIREVVSTKEHTVVINGVERTITNTNELLGYLNGVNGVKTGYTSKAGRCLVTSAKRDDFEIITVVLGADTRKIRTQDSIKLIEYAYKNYELVDIRNIAETEYENWLRINKRRIRINKGIKKNPEVYLAESRYTLYPVTKNNNISVESEVITKLEAPVEKDILVGKIIIKKDNEILEEIPIRTKKRVAKKGIASYLLEIIYLLKIII